MLFSSECLTLAPLLLTVDSALQGAHCEERLRIEIVHLQEQLDTRTEENGRWII